MIPIDKPSGWTSHDVVAKVRSMLKTQRRRAPAGRSQATGPAREMMRVGHTGTLDPFATGLLLVVVGPATRLIEYTHAWPKTYQATITLGAASDTDDVTGTITPAPPAAIPSLAIVQKTLQSFLGPQHQIPPAYSSIKIQGRRAYQRARVGESITLPSRRITIHRIKYLAYQYPHLTIQVDCTTGTYIRALGRDIGYALGSQGYVASLRRLQIGPFHIKHSIEKLSTGTIKSHLKPPTTLIAHLHPINLNTENVAQFIKGNRTLYSGKELPVSDPVAIFTLDNHLIGIAQPLPISDQPSHYVLQPTKVLETRTN